VEDGVDENANEDLRQSQEAPNHSTDVSSVSTKKEILGIRNSAASKSTVPKEERKVQQGSDHFPDEPEEAPIDYSVSGSLEAVELQEVQVGSSLSIQPIDCRCEHGRFPVLASCVTISNTDSFSSS
jgi:hypothetical protein